MCNVDIRLRIRWSSCTGQLIYRFCTTDNIMMMHHEQPLGTLLVNVLLSSEASLADIDISGWQSGL